MFVPLQKLELNYDILNFGWLNTRCLAILDTTEGFHLQDVRNQEDLETLDLSDVGLVYGSSFFKGLATGGNVSRAMAVAGERATYGSFMTFTNQLLLLGRQSFHVLLIRTWSERLDHLVKENRYLDALALGCEFYKDQGKTLVGLKGPKEKRKTVIAQKVVSILLKFLDVSMTVNFPPEGNMAVLSNYFDEVVPPCVVTCITLRRKDILFENVWATYNLDPFAKAKFLESLEVHILSDQLKNPPVGVTQELVTHYETVSRFQALEACLTHLSVVSLDIHQVMNLCWLHGLYDAIIYVYNNGMLDYVTPAEELLSVLTEAMASAAAARPNGEHQVVEREGAGSGLGLTQKQVDLGNKLLVYISCCLAGRAYPYGEIPRDRLAKVKYEVYNCLTALHTKKHKEDELTYPYLRALLTFDTQGLLNVVAIAFEEKEFNTEMGLCQKQRLVDILEKIICESEGYSPTQLGYLFTFIARQIAKGDKVFQVSRDLFDKFLDVLTDASTATDQTSSHHEERQQALLELIDAGGLQYFDREKLLRRSEAIGFYRILETLYEEAKEYDRVVDCILSDAPRRQQAFAFVQKVLLEDSYGDEAKAMIEKAFMKQLSTMVEVDVKRTAMVVYYYMPSYIPLVIAKLEDQRQALYQFLEHTMAYKEGGGSSKAAAGSSVVRKAEQAIDDAFELFVSLMCEFEPRKVASFLRTRPATYDVGAILKVCRRREGTVDAVAYLLEMDGRAEEAFELLKDSLDTMLSRVAAVVADAQREEGREAAELFWSQVNASVVILVQLCQRASARALNEEAKELWFTLLDCLLVPQRSLNEHVPELKDVVRHVVNSAIGYIPLRTVIEKILQDPIYQTGSFGDIKDFLVEMMEMYHYEETLLRSTVQLVRDDLHGQVVRRRDVAGRGVACRDLACDLCRDHVALNGGKCIVFQCGHKYHMPCLAMAGCAVVSELGDETWHCYKCVTKKNRGTEGLTRESASIAAPPGAEASGRQGVNLGDREIDEITNRDLVKAKTYLDNFKSAKSPLAVIEDMMASSSNAEQNETFHIEGADGESGLSIFDRSDFALKMWTARN